MTRSGANGTAIIAFDIGGSKTHAVRAVDGTIVREAVVGSANVSSVGDAEAGHQLDLAIERLGGNQDVRAVCAGAAGVDTPATVRRLHDLITDRLPCARVQIVHDSQLILAAAGVENGIALISGTGSVAWGRNGSRTARAGGWGYLLGDEGSGYWVAREAVRRTLACADSGAAPGQLGQLLAADCGLPDATELLNHFYTQTDRRYWAGRGRVVFELAKAGDPTSHSIVADAAAALAGLAAQVSARLDLTGPVVIAGGQAVNQPLLAAAVASELAQRGLTQTRVLDIDPVGGAVELATRLLADCPRPPDQPREDS